MVTGRNFKIHGPGGPSFDETRVVDTPDLRLALIEASTHPSQIGVLRDRLLNAISEFDIKSEVGQPQSCMAIEEALANAIYHGNLELASDLKEDGATKFTDLAKARSAQAPWKDRKVLITELATPFGLWITISDQGTGFDVAAALQRTIDPEALLASGRGLVMMRAFSDDLVFNKNGNEVTLVFYHSRNQDIRELLMNRARSRNTTASRQTSV